MNGDRPSPEVGALTVEELRAIGRVTIEFSDLEMMVKSFVAILAGTEPANLFLALSDLSFSQLSGVLSSLYNLHYKTNPNRRERFRRVMGQVKKAAEKRNTVIHANWSRDAKGRELLRIRYRRGRKKMPAPESRPMTHEELDRVADEIRDASGELIMLMLEKE